MIAQLVYDYKNLLGVWWKCTVQLFGWRSANIPGGLTIIATQDGFRACPLQLWECKGSKPGGLPEVDGLMGHTIINTHQHDTMFFERYRYLLPKHGNKYVKKNSPIHTKPQADPYPWVGHGVPNIPDKLCNIEKVWKGTENDAVIFQYREYENCKTYLPDPSSNFTWQIENHLHL